MLLIHSSRKLGEKQGKPIDNILISDEQKNRLDRIIEEGYSFADADLQDDLVELYDFHFYQEKDEKFAQTLVGKIKDKYTQTKKEAGIE